MSDFNECSLTRRDQKYQKHPNMFPIFIQFDDFTSVFSEPGSQTRFSEPCSENCDQNCGEEGSKMFEKWN